jgi:hypothetical protein
MNGILSDFLVLAVFDQIVDHARVSQGRSVAQRAEIILGNLAQDAAHDLAGAGLERSSKFLSFSSRANFASESRRTAGR